MWTYTAMTRLGIELTESSSLQLRGTKQFTYFLTVTKIKKYIAIFVLKLIVKGQLNK